jgi:hypothetical protein
MHANTLRWHEALGELVDNAFDANANRIEIRFRSKAKLEVIDDGRGCDNIEKMLTLGNHYHQATTQLGCYGVGLKEAACWLWGELYIETRHKDIVRRAKVNWERLASSDNWECPDDTQHTATAGEPMGTRLSFASIRRTTPDHKRIIDDLSYTFSPALRAGKQIVIAFPRKADEPCQAWQSPPRENVVQDEFTVNGKAVRIDVGIVKSGHPNPRPGFSFCYRHRVILNSALGSKGRSVSRICGFVDLGTGWALSKNKTDIVNDQHELEDAIWERCGTLVMQSAEQAELLQNEELTSSVTECLRTILTEDKKNAKASREKGEKTGTVTPKDTGRKHRKAKNTKPGDTLANLNIGQIRMEFQDRDDGRIGSVDIPGNVVYLNREHSRIASHRDTANRDALVDQCMTLLAFEAIEGANKGKLKFAREYEGFVDGLSSLLARQQSTKEPEKANIGVG